MKFLVVPEDFRNDGYVLQPIVTALLASLGFANPKVEICRDPLMGGVTEVLKVERLLEVIEQYEGMVDVFIICVDRDANHHRQQVLEHIEAELGRRVALIASQAWEELETWILAGVDLPQDWRWRDVRSARDVKENYFDPLAKSLGISDEPGGGRRTMAAQAARSIGRIRQLCSEDFDALARRLATHLP